jgi:signal transduction histidine kinase
VPVYLIVNEEELEVRIQDDGCGFDIAGVTPENLGLKIICERATAVQAKLYIQSVPGARMQIQMRWQAEKENNL